MCLKNDLWVHNIFCHFFCVRKHVAFTPSARSNHLNHALALVIAGQPCHYLTYLYILRGSLCPPPPSSQLLVPSVGPLAPMAFEEVTADAVTGLDLSRRALASLSPWLSPSHPGCRAPLGHLESLDASRNVLCSARGLEHLPRLRSLNLYFNRIEQLAELMRLRPAAATLQSLDLRLNPVARLEGYRRCVCQFV